MKLLCSRTPISAEPLDGLGEHFCSLLNNSPDQTRQRRICSQRNFTSTNLSKMNRIENYLSGIADVYSVAEIKELGISENEGLGKVNKKST